MSDFLKGLSPRWTLGEEPMYSDFGDIYTKPEVLGRIKEGCWVPEVLPPTKRQLDVCEFLNYMVQECV